MFSDDFDELGRAAGSDGASVMIWPIRAADRPEDDYDDLMGAWLAERGRVVESELLLTRALELLELLTRHDRPTSTGIRRETRRLIGEIKDQLA